MYSIAECENLANSRRLDSSLLRLYEILGLGKVVEIDCDNAPDRELVECWLRFSRSICERFNLSTVLGSTLVSDLWDQRISHFFSFMKPQIGCHRAIGQPMSWLLYRKGTYNRKMGRFQCDSGFIGNVSLVWMNGTEPHREIYSRCINKILCLIDEMVALNQDKLLPSVLGWLNIQPSSTP